MARAHFVKRARKDNPVAKAGESYWWWKFMQGGRGGPKRFSKEQPRQSQLTQSAFFGAVYAMQEAVEDFNTATADMSELETFRDEVGGMAQTIGDECQSSLDNMPDGLREGPSGEMLTERVSAMEEMVSTIEGVDCDEEDWETDAKDELENSGELFSDEDLSNLADEKMHEHLSQQYDELVAAVEYDGE